MRYILKTEAGVVEEYHGPAMGDTWYAANGYISYAGTLPLSRLDVVNGAVIELPEPEPTEEWVPISAFVMALYALIPAERVAAVLQNEAALKPALAGLALLSSDAAPGGIKYNSAGTASGWGFRSPNRSNSYNIVNVSANGILQELSWSSAWSGGIVPACIIA